MKAKARRDSGWQRDQRRAQRGEFDVVIIPSAWEKLLRAQNVSEEDVVERLHEPWVRDFASNPKNHCKKYVPEWVLNHYGITETEVLRDSRGVR